MSQYKVGPDETLVALLGKHKVVEHRNGLAVYGDFVAWRRENQEITHEPLYWRIDTEWAEFGLNDFVPFEPMRMRARMKTFLHNGYRSFELLQLQGIASDEELSEIAARASDPKLYSDMVLGELRKALDGSPNFIGSVDFSGDRIDLMLLDRGLKPDEDALRTLRAVVADAAKYRDGLLAEAGRQIYPGLVAHWTSEGEPPSSRDAFVASLRVKSLGVDVNDSVGEFSACIHDGGWLGGHDIHLPSSLSGSFGKVRI